MKNISLANKYIALLLCIVMASFFMPAFSFAEDKNTELEHDGCLVAVKDGSDVDTRNSDIEEVVEDEIYMADTVSDIREEIPASDIEYIEPNYVMELSDSYTLNDSKYSISKWAQNLMNVQEAWNRGYFGNYSSSSDAPTVAIIDTGIVGTGSGDALLHHEDLNYDNISAGINTIKDNRNTNDDHGHGTFIAGIISAIHNNGVGIAGDMPNLKIKAYKCATSSGRTDVANEVKAINAAIEDSVDVINLSLGMNRKSEIEQEAINRAANQGIIVCASAGNDKNSSYSYPASDENVISVGSINNLGERSFFSQFNKKVDCTAPGEGIISLDYTSSSGYKSGQGTSFSCPQVVALAAMCKSIDPTIDHDKFMELLKITSKDSGNSGYDTSFGWGLVDFGNMLDALIPKDNSIWAASITGISDDADYTGEEITFDELKITMPDGTELSADSDYTLSYYNNVNSATGLVVIKGVGDYCGRINKYFTINGLPEPEKPSERLPIHPGGSGGDSNPGSGGSNPGSGGSNPGGSTPPSSGEGSSGSNSNQIEKPVREGVIETTVREVSAGKKTISLRWKRNSVDGYQVQYSTTKNFKKEKSTIKSINKNKTSYKINKLKSKKKYYVRMRNYQIKKGGREYSPWSKKFTVKTR